MRASSRALLAAALCGVPAACDVVLDASATLVLPPAAAPDSARQRAVAALSRVAARHGLAPSPVSGPNPCFVRGSLTLCAGTREGALWVAMNEHRYPFARFTRRAELVWRELLDGLRAEFGAERVHECDPPSGPAPRDPVARSACAARATLGSG